MPQLCAYVTMIRLKLVRTDGSVSDGIEAEEIWWMQ